MNLTEYRALPPEEKNALFAQHVMGWEKHPHNAEWIDTEGHRVGWCYRKGAGSIELKYHDGIYRPLNDLNACFEGVKKIAKEKKCYWALNWEDIYSFIILDRQLKLIIPEVVSANLNEAIMEACLMARGVIE